MIPRFIIFGFCYITFGVLSYCSLKAENTGLEMFSEEEIQQLKLELDGAAQKCEAYLNSLTPEERAEFERFLAEVQAGDGSFQEDVLPQQKVSSRWRSWFSLSAWRDWFNCYIY